MFPIFQNLAAKVRSKFSNGLRELLNGRPMTWTRTVFLDPATMYEVHEYRDSKGRLWFATNRWGLIRTPAPVTSNPAQ